MQFLRNATVLLSRSTRLRGFGPAARLLNEPRRKLCASSTDDGSEDLTTRVLELVRKFDRIDSSKIVTERSDFHKDLSLDSLDRVELIMAIEQEFSVEIPNNKADKISCCTDVVKYIAEAQTIMKETPE